MFRTERRVDIVGPYTAYIFPDGHTETDPPGRPLLREDIQRLRRQQRAKVAATRMVASAAIRSGLGRVQARESSATLDTLDALENFRQSSKAASQLALTTAAPVEMVELLVQTVFIGGQLTTEPDPIDRPPAPKRSVMPAVAEEGLR